MKIRLFFLLFFAILCSCSASENGEQMPEFRLESRSAMLDEGTISDIRLSVSYDSGVNWSEYSFSRDELGITLYSNDTTVVSIAAPGVLRAKVRGRASVRAVSKKTGQSATLSCRVVEEDEKAFLESDWTWKALARDAKCGTASVAMFDSVQNISVAEYPADKYTTTIAYNTGTGCLTTESAALKEGGSIAINGSFFDTSALVSAVTFLYGGEIVSTSTSSEATNRSTGAIGIAPDGKITIFPYISTEIAGWTSKFSTALASGPLLLQKGRPMVFKDRDFNNLRHPRTMMGLRGDGTVVFVVVDGRYSGKAAGMSIPEMAKLAQYLELDSAINLDGGGSSTLWTSEFGVLNYPCDNGKWDHLGQRRDPTVIVAK